MTYNKSRIKDLPVGSYQDDLKFIADSDLCGTVSLTIDELFSKNNIKIDIPDDPPAAGYQSMMITTTEDKSNKDKIIQYKTYDIVTPSTISAGITQITLPDVLNLSATSYEVFSISKSLNKDFFKSYLTPGSFQTSIKLTPTALTAASPTYFQNKHCRIVTKTATEEDLGVTVIYNGEPLSSAYNQQPVYAIASERIFIDNIEDVSALVFNVDFQLSCQNPKNAKFEYGFIVDDQFKTPNVISSGMDIADVDPKSYKSQDNPPVDYYIYRNISSYYNTSLTSSYKYTRALRGDNSYVFAEDFQMQLYGLSVGSKNYNPYVYPRTSGTSYQTGGSFSYAGSYVRYFSISGPIFSRMHIMNPQTAYVLNGTIKENTQSTVIQTKTYIKDVTSFRFVIGTYFYKDAEPFKVVKCHIKISKPA